MKSTGYKTELGMLLIMAAGGALLAACKEAQADQASPTQQTQQSEATAPEESTTDKAAPVTYTPREPGEATTQADDQAATPRVSCRRVTASSIPAWTSPSGGSVGCTFLQGDVFSHFGLLSTGRYITWCPRGVPPAQGFTAYAQAAGTVDGGCG